MTWTDEIGPWDFTPSVVKNQYNEGNLISDSSNPVWSSVHTGVPITDTHVPCGYWPLGYSEPVVPAPPSSGYLYGTGSNGNGQLGLGNTIAKQVFTQSIDVGVEFVDISCGYNHTLALDTNGRIWTCGSDDNGQQGRDFSGATKTLTLVDDRVYTAISAGGRISFAIDTEGVLWGWGRNNLYHELGLTGGDKGVPTQIATNVTSVSAGGYFTNFISSGKLYVCGTDYGSKGMLGLGIGVSAATPTEVTGITPDKIYSGAYFSIAQVGSTFYGTGTNNLGQLGLGDNTNRGTYTLIDITGDTCECGSYHSVILKNGVAYSTGYNYKGALGLSDTNNRNEFTEITGFTWKSLFAGFDFTVGIGSDDKLYTFGVNNSGELGTGNTTWKWTPTLISADQWIFVTAYGPFSMAIKTTT